MEPSLYDSHTHTHLCRHAKGEPLDYARAAAARGLDGVIITDHNPIPGGWEASIRMKPRQFTRYLEMVEAARRQWAGIVDVRLGIESDFFPGMEPYLEKFHASAPFDFVWGSVHCHTRSYKEAFFTGDIPAYTRLYYEYLAQSAETGLFDAITHIDVPKFMWPEQWNIEEVIGDVRRALDRIAATGVAIELNTSGLYKPYPEMNPGPELLREMAERDIPVVLGSDAHMPERTGGDFEQALCLLKAAGYTEISWFCERKRQITSISAAREKLAKSRA